MHDKLNEPSMDEAQIQLVLKYHDLMKLYMDERINDPYNEDVTTTHYLQEAIALLSSTVPITNDRDILMDTLLLVKCFAATVLMSSKRSLQIPMFLDWVHTVQKDVAKWVEPLKEKQLASRAISKDFWKLLIHYTITGKFSEATELLQQNDLAEDDDFGYLSNLLEAYPTEASKYVVFMNWRRSVLTWYNNMQERETPHTHEKELKKIALILIGENDVITSNSTEWISAVSGLYLYADPSPECLEGHFHTANSVENLRANVIPTWEEGCKALFESKPVAALGCLRVLDISSAVVISEFCSERGLLQKYTIEGGKPGGGVREELALSYIITCLAEPPLVEIGTEYLINVATPRAKQTAEQLLPQLVARSPEFAELAIDTAEQLNMPDLEISLCKNAAEEYKNELRYVSAMSFYYKASDYQSMKETGWNLFRDILVSKQALGDEMTISILHENSKLSSIDLPMSIKDNLAPAAVLLALIESIEAEDVDGILINLSGLLTFPDPPLEYYPLLVALVSGISGSILTLKSMTMLMNALDLWESAASESTKQLSYNLIAEASSNPAWQNTLGEDQDPQKLTWLLKKQLAKEVCI